MKVRGENTVTRCIEKRPKQHTYNSRHPSRRSQAASSTILAVCEAGMRNLEEPQGEKNTEATNH